MEEKKANTVDPSAASSSSSGTAMTATTDPDVYWDSEGSWHQWGGTGGSRMRMDGGRSGNCHCSSERTTEKKTANKLCLSMCVHM
jgi:hypothetical protein